MWVVALVLVVGMYGEPAGDRGGQVSWAWLGREFNSPYSTPSPRSGSTLESKARASSGVC